jgi:hypothetical protein
VKSPKSIAILLTLNVGLFLGILYYVLQARLVSPFHTSEAASEAPAAVQLSADSPAVSENVVIVTNQVQWAQLESEDYKTYVARLRAIGCPEQTIRDIIIADLDKLLAPELRAAHGRRNDLQYWHSEEEELMNDINPRESFKKQREIDQRKREIVRELVNVDLARERMKATGEEDYYERRLSFLPEDRRTQVRELLEKFDEAEQKIRDKETENEGVLSIADHAQLRTLRQQRETELQNVLTPQEQTQYDLWLSPVANEIRHALYGMNATEQEFLAVYQAKKAFDDLWGKRDPDLLDSLSRQQRAEAQGEMETQIQSSLGEQRYAEFKRGQDDDYHLLSALVTRFKLPREKANEVYGYKTVALGYRRQLQADTSLTAQQRDEGLKGIAKETTAAVRQVLGTKAFNHYVRSGQGRWLNE